MIGQELYRGGSFWSFLTSVDEDLAKHAQRQGCSCGGRLHVSGGHELSHYRRAT